MKTIIEKLIARSEKEMDEYWGDLVWSRELHCWIDSESEQAKMEEYFGGNVLTRRKRG